MEPGYSAGDVVLADLRKPLQDGYPVVVKIRNQAPVCRIYAKRSSRVILSPADSNMPAIEAKTNEVEWCHGVVRHFRQLR
jgi:SOS-response transcriptional repressor LexA